ncbi:MAG TPA: amidohydrolase family protein [Actinocatenispora sp.]
MLAVRAARLFDGDARVAMTDPTVLVRDGRILSVESGGAVPEGATLVDLGDVTLLPGLVDAHVHLVFDAGANPVAAIDGADDEAVLDGMRAAARVSLAAGITTVRDLGDRGYLALRLRDELATDPYAGPRVLAAGPPITTTRGHCWYLGGEADGERAVRDAVRRRAERGADVVKVMASGGELTPGTHSHEAQYTVAELRAIVDEAHRYGLPVAAHAHAGAAIENVLAAGVDVIEHCSFMSEYGVDDRPDVIAALAASDVAVSATLAIRSDRPPPPRIAARLGDMIAVINRIHDTGIPLVCSSDAGIGPPKPHGVLPYTTETTMRLCGWDPAAALRAVTSLPAALCGLAGRAGRIAPGYDADLLAVAGDPLSDPAALRNVRAVYRTGTRVR